jgi:hypothetical protein
MTLVASTNNKLTESKWAIIGLQVTATYWKRNII